LVAVALVLAGCGDDEPTSSTATTSTTSSSTTAAVVERSDAEAIESWAAEHRDEVFPGFEGELAGPCREGLQDVLCTIPREDLGPRRITAIGVAASDWGADLLLERADERWTVVDVWRWDLESGAVGPPFSPLTALAEWWSTTEPGTVLVRECEQIDPATMDQELVCAVLVESDDETRTYRTGPPPDVDEHEVELRHEPDDTWAVR
jgi:hypothetical protein